MDERLREQAEPALLAQPRDCARQEARASGEVARFLGGDAWLAFIIVWQRFEDYVIQPLVYGRTLRVNPIVTIVSVLAGAALLGILGALLAIPTAAAIQIVLREWWSNRQHPEPTAQSPPMQLAGGRVQAAPTD